MSAPQVSVIVCSRNRDRQLKDCLAAIEAAASRTAEGAVEIVVVDNGSTDGTAGVIEQFRKASSLQVVSVVEEEKGLSRARNAGMAAASGALLFFTDDDCRVDAECFVRLLASYASGPSEVVRGGRVERGNLEDLPVSIRTASEPMLYAPPQKPGGFIMGCNMAIPRSVVDKVGAFNERLGAGAPCRAGEDTDYVLRAVQSGACVMYDPTFCVAHFHGRRSKREVRSIVWGYEIGNGALYAKHWRTSPWLLRHGYWTLRGALREWIGGPRFAAEHGISHWFVLSANLTGAFRYTFGAVAAYFRGAARA